MRVYVARAWFFLPSLIAMADAFSSSGTATATATAAGRSNHLGSGHRRFARRRANPAFVVPSAAPSSRLRINKEALCAENKRDDERAEDRLRWQLAPGPNYDANEELHLPRAWSEDDRGLRGGEASPPPLDRSTVKSPILDFWGEGRNEKDPHLKTGFRTAYNVNYRYQLVNPGSDDGGNRIPNLIPVESYDDPDIRAYVRDGTFDFVTVMGAPITERAAKEMARAVRKDDDGMIVSYGEVDEESRAALEKAASGIGFARDRLTELLLDRVEGLGDDDIVVASHPEHSRAYLNNRGQGTNVTVAAVESKWIAVGDKASFDYSIEEGCALVGEKKISVEQGGFFYKSARIQLSNRFVQGICDVAYDPSGWVHAYSGLSGTYVCPKGAVLMGRKREGSGTGKTWYRYGWVYLRGHPCTTYRFSKWKKAGSVAAGSIFECREREVIVGEKRCKDKIGCVWFMSAKVKLLDL